MCTLNQNLKFERMLAVFGLEKILGRNAFNVTTAIKKPSQRYERLKPLEHTLNRSVEEEHL